ncbi:caffeoyl-CoA O-methyltransferase, partial [Tremellales sp. Uapishka_1]
MPSDLTSDISGSKYELESLAAAEADVRGDVGTAAATDEYLRVKLLPKGQWGGDPLLQEGLARERAANMPDISVSPMQGQLLSILALGIKAENILEIGTLGGYSTSFLAKTLPSHGQIDTIELSPEHAKVAQANFLAMDLYPFPKVHVGKALELLQDPAGAFTDSRIPGVEQGLDPKDRGYDLVFIDADKENILAYFLEALRITRKGGIILVDNAVRGGRIAYEENDKPEIDVVGLRKMYDWIQKDDGKTVLSTAIQTVGEKTWDGFAIAYKL